MKKPLESRAFGYICSDSAIARDFIASIRQFFPQHNSIGHVKTQTPPHTQGRSLKGSYWRRAAIIDWRLLLSNLDRLRCRSYHGGLLAFRLADVDTALEERAVFNADTRSGNIATQRTFSTNIHAVSGRNISTNLAQYHDFTRRNAGRNLTVPADSHTVTGQVHAALYFSIDIQRL